MIQCILWLQNTPKLKPCNNNKETVKWLFVARLSLLLVNTGGTGQLDTETNRLWDNSALRQLHSGQLDSKASLTRTIICVYTTTKKRLACGRYWKDMEKHEVEVINDGCRNLRYHLQSSDLHVITNSGRFVVGHTTAKYMQTVVRVS